MPTSGRHVAFSLKLYIFRCNYYKNEDSYMKDINSLIFAIRDLITQDNYDKALELTRNLEKEALNSTAVYNIGANLIDIGSGNKDVKLIKEGIDKLTSIIGDFDKELELYSAIGNAYLGLFAIKEYKKNIKLYFKSKFLQNAKKYYRQALKSKSIAISNARCRLYTNYANCLDNLGRGVEAIAYYNKALNIDKNFSMALCNRGKAYEYFSYITQKYRDEILSEAYSDIIKGLEDKALIIIGGTAAKKDYVETLKRIENNIASKDLLIDKIIYPAYSMIGLTDFEKFFLEFCAKNNLFMNFCIHENISEDTVRDPIFINLLSDKDDKKATYYKLSKYINQIKEDYMTARLNLVQSQFKRDDFKNISERTLLVNTEDNTKFNLYVGLLKVSFVEAYNILDKIAFFINDYLNLGLSENSIYFLSVNIWEQFEALESSEFEEIINQVEGKKKQLISNVYEKDCNSEKYILNKNNLSPRKRRELMEILRSIEFVSVRDEIANLDNFSLLALFDIYRDFNNGYFKGFRDIRNAIIHRYYEIKDESFNGELNTHKNVKFEGEILKLSIDLFQLVKASIIYLVNLVNTEERKKLKKFKGGISKFNADTSQIF